ncbi:MAG: NAD(P)-binding protein [Xanthomonadales bacterium]|jgi:NADPH-dependent glutamate synthase beta subunit-like oxidoreductase|nr:NAD(P)-binding protein [Xanthomonadales bacterium]MDH3939861.1 NAD(P)-binding protein [Xanthomonadales bacterium]MDH3999707.1 NAD(P)-binding protein [Xanthomonadales bacterium]
MSTDRSDITLPPDLSQKSGTGPVRLQEPIYVNSIPPCNHACPAGENIQGWLDKAQAGDFEAAWRILVADNPLPSIHGRVCYHPCESSCNRQHVDDAVSIHAVERFLGDLALENGWVPEINAEPSGKKILVVGAGPSGLSAAWHLALLGHEVEIREAGPMAGGMMRFGIPAYRMPRDILDGEVSRIEKLGVKITLNSKVEDVTVAMEQEGFDAVFMAIGAHVGKHVDIPARDSGRILDAVSYLASVEKGEEVKLGRRVAIYGGGNTAMDAARTAKRMGAEEAMIIYRRDREHMPAHEFEAIEAEAEGIKINWLRTIREIDSTTFQVEVMEVDENGRPQPTGEIETLEADSLVLALGQNVDTSVLEHIPGVSMGWDGVVEVNENMMTGAEGVFAGGDMVPSDRTVTIATGHGKKAARHIDAWLKGTTYSKDSPRPTVDFDALHLHYYTDAQKREQASIAPEHRTSDFREVTAGLDKREAVFEASRCYSCGNCFECDGCFGACPEDAIIKLGKGKGYDINYDLCIGCRACFLQCPCHAMEMVETEAVA